MLLTIDIGNSNIVFGLFKHKKLSQTIRTETYDTEQWQRVIEDFPLPCPTVIVSVVPVIEDEVIHKLNSRGFNKIFNIKTLRSGTGIHFGNNGVNAEELGADLFVNAVANYHLFQRRCLSVDLGTASKFCVIEGDGLYRGTTIAPGMKLSLNALIKRAPLLPEIPFLPTEKIINNSTVPCLQSGIFYGYCSLVDGLIKRIKKEQGDLFVVLTGGIGNVLHEFLNEIDVFMPNLTLQGAEILYRMITEV